MHTHIDICINPTDKHTLTHTTHPLHKLQVASESKILYMTFPSRMYTTKFISQPFESMCF